MLYFYLLSLNNTILRIYSKDFVQIYEEFDFFQRISFI